MAVNFAIIQSSWQGIRPVAMLTDSSARIRGVGHEVTNLDVAEHADTDPRITMITGWSGAEHACSSPRRSAARQDRPRATELRRQLS